MKRYPSLYWQSQPTSAQWIAQGDFPPGEMPSGRVVIFTDSLLLGGGVSAGNIALGLIAGLAIGWFLTR